MRPIIYNLNSIRPPLTGIGRYSVELLRELLIQRPNITVIKNGERHSGKDLSILLDKLDSFSITGQRGSLINANNSASRVRKTIGNIPLSRSIYRALDTLRFAKASRSFAKLNTAHHDLNYSLNPKTSNNLKRINVSTIYDLSNRICPETHPKHRVQYLNRYFSNLRASESQIITISNSVKSELVEYYGIAESRIHVTHLAADERFHLRSIDDCHPTLEAYNLKYKKYVLCVATLEPRKNLSRVLDAYEALSKETQKEFPLVMAGTPGWKSAALEDRIGRLHHSGLIKKLEFVQQSSLPFLYAGAAAFIYPSLYEGFGLPLLEAMQSGCPCITSNTGALAEVSGEHAIQVDPLQSDDIAHQLNRLLREPDLNYYYSMSGQQRAKDFTWSKTAQMTSEIYDSL